MCIPGFETDALPLSLGLCFSLSTRPTASGDRRIQESAQSPCMSDPSEPRGGYTELDVAVPLSFLFWNITWATPNYIGMGCVEGGEPGGI